jgi:serine/threonine protein kinase
MNKKLFILSKMNKLLKCNYNFKLKNIGSGSYGEVSVVEKDGEKFAYKKIKPDKILKESYFYNPLELDIIFRLQSPYLIRGIDISSHNQCTKEIGIVTEYIDGNLEKDIENIPFKQRKRLMYDITQGLKCMHDNNFLHLDVKLENTLYRKEEQPRCVLIDYGLSSYAPYGIEKGIYTNQGRFTPDFNSPEALPDNEEIHYYNNKNDIWALGLTFCQMIADGSVEYIDEEISSKLNSKSSGNGYRDLSKLQMHLFADKNIDGFLKDYVFHYGPNDIENKDLLIDLLKKMLKVNSKLRCDIYDVVNHPYFKEFQNDRSCFVKVPKLVDNYPYDENYLKGVNNMVKICKQEIPNDSAYILFMAVDIYMRFISNMENYPEAKDDIFKAIEDLPRMCILIANKYFYWSESSENELVQEIDEYILTETLIYRIIGGRIRDERYFSECNNTNEVKFVYKHFIEPVKGGVNPNLYKFLSYNGKEFVESNRIQGSDVMTFNLKIKNL